jgi:V/A-type H+-transporting ATPase subunit K
VGLALLAVCFALLACSSAWAETEHGEAAAPADPQSAKWAYIAAAVSVGLGCLGAGIAVAYVGSAAVGAVAEKPQLAARTLIFVGLAEGIAIYGLIIAIMLLGKV